MNGGKGQQLLSSSRKKDIGCVLPGGTSFRTLNSKHPNILVRPYYHKDQKGYIMRQLIHLKKEFWILKEETNSACQLLKCREENQAIKKEMTCFQFLLLPKSRTCATALCTSILPRESLSPRIVDQWPKLTGKTSSTTIIAQVGPAMAQWIQELGRGSFWFPSAPVSWPCATDLYNPILLWYNLFPGVLTHPISQAQRLTGQPSSHQSQQGQLTPKITRGWEAITRT